MRLEVVWSLELFPEDCVIVDFAIDGQRKRPIVIH